jgi:transposase
MNNTPTLGIDIARLKFAAALRFDVRRSLKKEFNNTPAGHRALLRWLHQHFAGTVRAGIESTNTYAESLSETLHAAGHPVHLLNPERVACYARCLGQRNKTDPADALTIATFVAAHEQLTLWQPLSPAQKSLRSLTRARQQLVQTLRSLTNQLRTADGPGRAHLARLNVPSRPNSRTLVKRSPPTCRPSPTCAKPCADS